MEASGAMPLMSYLDEITDPRRAGYAHRHDLQEMLVIAICATLSDVNTFEDVAFWATQKSGLAEALPEAEEWHSVARYL